MCVSPPSVNQMVKTLEKKGLVLRQPGVARSIRVLVPEGEIPSWRGRSGGKCQSATSERKSRDTVSPVSSPANLYVLTISMSSSSALHRSFQPGNCLGSSSPATAPLPHAYAPARSGG